MAASFQSPEPAGWRAHWHEIIFEADTRGGRLFDLVLIAAIVASVLVVMLDSVSSLHDRHAVLFAALEWGFTLLFTCEYVLRLLTVRRPLNYAFSFFGIIDLLAVAPTYVSLLIPGSQYLLVVRIFRLLRIFRVLKLVRFVGEAGYIMRALKASARKITVFLFTLLTLVTVLGALMYIIEGADNGFTSIPVSMYWAVVTLTTVGYGDISPQTNIGRALASLIMVLGYSIIAVPTGIVSVEMRQERKRMLSTQVCRSCSKEGHDIDAKYCKHCGEAL